MKKWLDLTNIGKKRRLNKILLFYGDKIGTVQIFYCVEYGDLNEAREMILSKNINIQEEEINKQLA